MDGWSFAAGLALGESFAIGLVYSDTIVRATKQVMTHKRRQSRWKIGGETFTARRVTRAVMEAVMQAQAEVSAPAMIGPFGLAALFGGAENQDEIREKHLQLNAARIQSTYQTCALLLVGANGEPPTEEFLSEHLTIDEASAICQAVL